MAAELFWRALANGAVIFAIVRVVRRRGQRAADSLRQRGGGSPCTTDGGSATTLAERS